MPPKPTFQRAYSDERKAQRANDLLSAARTLAMADGVRAVTLTAIAEHAGVHVSAVRRYFESREEILLSLAEQGYDEWAHDVAERLQGRYAMTPPQLAETLVATVVDRPLLCDLLTHVTLSLEREVSYERVRKFKQSASAAVALIADAVANASMIGRVGADELVIATVALTASLWQAGHPGDIVARLYQQEPDLVHLGVDFGPTLTSLLTALVDGLATRAEVSGRDSVNGA